jgi:hypothetical protein
MTQFRDVTVRRGDYIFVRHLRFGGNLDNASATRADDAGTQKTWLKEYQLICISPFQ